MWRAILALFNRRNQPEYPLTVAIWSGSEWMTGAIYRWYGQLAISNLCPTCGLINYIVVNDQLAACPRCGLLVEYVQPQLVVQPGGDTRPLEIAPPTRRLDSRSLPRSRRRRRPIKRTPALP